MDEEWSKLQSYQHLQNKLFIQLGVTDYGGADDTMFSCQSLIDMDSKFRPEFILERWGVLTDKVSYLLDQLIKLEKKL